MRNETVLITTGLMALNRREGGGAVGKIVRCYPVVSCKSQECTISSHVGGTIAEGALIQALFHP